MRGLQIADQNLIDDRSVTQDLPGDNLSGPGQVRCDSDLADWLGRSLAENLPGVSGILALCPAETRDWSVFQLPFGSSDKWPGDHPFLDEIREQEGGKIFRLEEKVPGLSGSDPVWVVTLRDIHGRLLGALLLSTPDSGGLSDNDISWLLDNTTMGALLIERSVSEKRIKQLESDLAELEMLKSSFMDTMSHELKTPLTSIIGFSSLALNLPQLDQLPPLPEFIRSIHNSAIKLDSLISELLVMSNLASAESSIEITELSFTNTVESFRDEWLPRIDNGQRVSFSGEPLDCNILADEYHFNRVLEHLVQNALKFSPADRNVELSWSFIAGRRRSDQSDFVRVNIQDSGQGIPEDEIDRIFQKFYQIDSSSTREQGGAGLGLALAKEFTEAMGGKLWVRSQLGGGSTFSFTVPVPRISKPETETEPDTEPDMEPVS